MIDSSTVKALIASLRGRGLSQTQIAKKIGVSQTTVSRWERGKVGTQVDRLSALARFAQHPVSR